LPRLFIGAGVLAITAWIVIFLPSLALGDPMPGHDREIFLMSTVLPALSATFLLSGSAVGLRRLAQSPSLALSFARIGYIFAILFGGLVAYWTVRVALKLPWG
jgi:NhaP-type Na+/H+ or K+/H+ antiporter